ncbi:MAG: NAD-dependent epimerase/dehydratase family protein [Chitinophagaceae bacterium]
MHYLITGGAGFIGSQLIRTILQREPNAQITCIDNFDPFYSERIKRHNILAFASDPRFRLLELDVSVTTPQEIAKRVGSAADTIIHLAARAGVRPSIADPDGYVRSNVLGLQHLLDYARAAGVMQFVFASSSSVYGVNPNLPWMEEEKLLPISPYAMTKLSGEMMGHVYHSLYGIRFLALRFFTVYGPGQRPDLAIHQFVRKIDAGEPIRVFGDGSSSRDYTFVTDIVNGILAAVAYSRTGFEIFNIGNNQSVPLNSLIAAIEEVVGKKAIIDRQAEQPGDVPHTYADISKARRELGYQPVVDIDAGLTQFWHWFQANRLILTNG